MTELIEPPPAPTRWLPLQRLLARVLSLLDRYPWLLPLGSFVAGAASYFMVRRGETLARSIAIVALLGWPWLLVQGWLHRYLIRRFNSRWTPYALQMVTQSIQQEVLFFALPFIIGATQRDWGQWLFTSLACVAALVSTLDPIYEKRIAQRPALGMLFHAYCSFVCALVVIPIALKVQLENALPLALAITGLWLLLGLPRVWSDLSTQRARTLGLTGLLLAPFLLWLLRAHVPAAGLSVTDARISQTIDGLDPGNAVTTFSTSALKGSGAIAFVAIRAPMGLEQSVVFQWVQNGQLLDRIPAEIHGGGKTGWRTWSRKRNFPEDPRGDWSVDLETPDGQLIQRLEFRVS
ncbi:MAG: hypothetical protein JWQ90_4583 [Hydrocarboniphaga sp.]|uniref:DUF5924 family protein n=1 Tax=Hydrocarboniphaga sp. TaxID=2033016 RepID=UPI002604C43E|nr:DUF2914 domain-containing protein [Hydrocarboniphaga sp.]MDB5972133.1 hypothetical protein [Hydrocarboniphaga sp.]